MEQWTYRTADYYALFVAEAKETKLLQHITDLQRQRIAELEEQIELLARANTTPSAAHLRPSPKTPSPDDTSEIRRTLVHAVIGAFFAAVIISTTPDAIAPTPSQSVPAAAVGQAPR